MGAVEVNGYTIEPGANLRNANLSGCVYEGAESPDGTYFPNSAMVVEGAKSSELKGANLEGADLYGASLFGMDLRGANLSRADLRLVHACDAKFAKANFSWSNLSAVDIGHGVDNPSSPNFAGADFAGANFTGANLSRMFFDNRLSGANFSGANLSGASFFGSDLSLVNFAGANLSGAALSDELSEVKFAGAIFRGAFADEETKWPVGDFWNDFGPPETEGVLFGNPLVLTAEDMAMLEELTGEERRVVAASLERKAKAERNGADIPARIPRDADDFETVCEEWMQKAGFAGATRTPKGPDGGIDVIASDAVGQAKFHPSQKVTGESVRALVGSKVEHGKNRALFFHYGPGYTPDAITTAQNTGVELYDLDVETRRFNRIA